MAPSHVCQLRQRLASHRGISQFVYKISELKALCLCCLTSHALVKPTSSNRANQRQYNRFICVIRALLPLFICAKLIVLGIRVQALYISGLHCWHTSATQNDEHHVQCAVPVGVVLVSVWNAVLCHCQNTAVLVFSAAGCDRHAPDGLSKQAHKGEHGTIPVYHHLLVPLPGSSRLSNKQHILFSCIVHLPACNTPNSCLLIFDQ